MSLRLRKNDTVVVLKGRANGKRGKILRVDVDKQRAYVEGVNLVKRFTKKTRKNPQGGLIEHEVPIPLSNLALFCVSCAKPARFRTNVLKDGSKTRLCAECQNALGQVS